MIVVYVRHYLTEEGMHYFTSEWYPHVFEILQTKEGFISIDCKFESDIAFIDLRFADKQSLNDWCKEPDHELFISKLDRYRSRNYWESVATFDPNKNPEDLCWDLNACKTQ